MFINCPNCSALVATDLATGLPPERCSQCGFGPLARDASAVPVFPPTPLAPQQEPEPVRPQATPVFVPLRPSGPPPPVEDAASGTPEVPQAPVPAPTARPVEPIPPPPALPPEPAPAAPQLPADKAAPAVTAEPEATLVAGPADLPSIPSSGAAAALDPVAAPRPAPRFLARRSGGAAGVDRREIAIAAGLALLLVVQLLLADRDRLAASAAWRPVVAALCTPLPCSVPPWREPRAIGVQQRDVRPAPERPGVLRVSANIRNESRWAQAWPRLVLTLSDVDGRALGMRAFEPAEYLAAPPTDITIASGQEAAISMEIVEPSPHAVAFNLDFR